MNMIMEEVQPLEDLEPAILDLFWVDAFKPKLCDEKDILVVAFFASRQQVADQLQAAITSSPAGILTAEASSEPDADGFYIVIVELDRQKTMYNELTVLLESIQPLSRFDTWYFKPFDYDEYFEWNEVNFTETVPQDPQSYEELQLDINVSAEADDRSDEIGADQAVDHTGEDHETVGLSALSRSLNSELRKQFGHLIKLNQRLLRKFDKLQTDHKYLQRQLKLYQKREKLALTRERQDLQRIRRLEGELSMLAYSNAGQRDVVVAESSETVNVLTGRQTEPMDSDKPPTVSTTDGTGDRLEPYGPDSIPSGGKTETGSGSDGDNAGAPVDAEAAETEPIDTDEVIDLEDPLDIREDADTGSGSDVLYDTSTESSRSEAGLGVKEASDGIQTGGSSDETGDPLTRASSPFEQGMRSLKAKHYDAAIDYFSSVEADSEEAPRAFYNLAVLFYMRKNFEAANHYAEMAFLGGVQSAEQILEFSRAKQQELQEKIQAQEEENPQPEQTEAPASITEDKPYVSASGDVESATQSVADEAESDIADDRSSDAHGPAGVEGDLDAYYYTLGQAALEKGDIATAIDYFSAVEDHAHQAPISRYYLAILYMRSNMYDEARLWAVKAKDMGVVRANKILELIDERISVSPMAGLESSLAQDDVSIRPINDGSYGPNAAEKRLTGSEGIPGPAVGILPDTAAKDPMADIAHVRDAAEMTAYSAEPIDSAPQENPAESRSEDVGAGTNAVENEGFQSIQDLEEVIKPQVDLMGAEALAGTTYIAAAETEEDADEILPEPHQSAGTGHRRGLAGNEPMDDGDHFGEEGGLTSRSESAAADTISSRSNSAALTAEEEQAPIDGVVLPFSKEDSTQAAKEPATSDAGSAAHTGRSGESGKPLVRGDDHLQSTVRPAPGEPNLKRDIRPGTSIKTEAAEAVMAKRTGSANNEAQRSAAAADAAGTTDKLTEAHSRKHDESLKADNRSPVIDGNKVRGSRALSGQSDDLDKSALRTGSISGDGGSKLTPEPVAVDLNRQEKPERLSETTQSTSGDKVTATPGITPATHDEKAETELSPETRSPVIDEQQKETSVGQDEPSHHSEPAFEDENSLADVYDVLVGSSEDFESADKTLDQPQEYSGPVESIDTKQPSLPAKHDDGQTEASDLTGPHALPSEMDGGAARSDSDDHIGPGVQPAGPDNRPSAADQIMEKPAEPAKPETKQLDHYMLGKAALTQKNYKKAIKHLTAIDHKSPKAPKAQYMLGCIYYSMKRYEEAASHAQLALDMGVSIARSLLDKIKKDLLKKLSAKKKAKSANKATTQASTFEQDLVPNHGEETVKEKAVTPEEAKTDAGTPAQSPIANPQASPAEKPGTAAVNDQSDRYSDIADLSADVVNNYLEQFQDAPLDDEFRATETFAVSDAYDFFNDVQDEDTYGTNTFDRLVENKTDPTDSQTKVEQETEPDYFTLGIEALGQKKYDDALNNLLKAGNSTPNDPRVHYSLAITYYRLNDYPHARQSARIAFSGGVKAAKKVLELVKQQEQGQKASQGKPATTRATAIASTGEAAAENQSANEGASQEDLLGEAISEPTDTQTIGDSIVFGSGELEADAVSPHVGSAESQTGPIPGGEAVGIDPASPLQSEPAAAPKEAAVPDTVQAEGEDDDELDLEATDFDTSPLPMDLSSAANPEEVNKYLTMGQKAVDKKDYLRAIKHFTKITDLLPKDPLGYYNLAIISYRLNYYTTARAHAQKAVDLGLAAAQKILNKIDSKQLF